MTKPEIQEIVDYFQSHGSTIVEAQKFYFYYESVGWVVGKNKPMKSWKGCAGGWILRAGNFNKKEDGNKFSEESIRDRLSRW